MSDLGLSPYRLTLTAPWRGVTQRQGWLVSAKDEQGRLGWGDACGWPGQDCAAPVLDPERSPSVEAALADLAAQQAGLPLRQFLSPKALDSLPVNAVADSTESVALAQAEGYSVIKIKVGLRSVDEELAFLRALPLTPGTLLRLDANRAWSFDEAAAFTAGLAGLPIDHLEEPLAEPKRLKELQTLCDFPLALDESLAAWKLIPLPRLVIKPSLLGLRKSLALIHEARSAGRDCIVTSLLDSAVGVAAAAHLAAAAGLGDHAHGLATGSWFQQDLAESFPIRQGRLFFTDAPGLGVSPR